MLRSKAIDLSSPTRTQAVIQKDIKLLQARLAVPHTPLAQVQTLLIRPDVHVAWASGERDHERRLHQLSAALTAWCNVQLCL